MNIRSVWNKKANPPGKLADAELYFTQGPLEGLKLIGFSVWERKTGGGRNATLPARPFSVRGGRRPGALVFGGRRAPLVLAPPPHRRQHGAEPSSRSDPRGLRRARGASGRSHGV